MKGDKMRYASIEANELLLERLAALDLTSKKMFGGHGVFYDGKMIGLIDSKGKAFLKADDSTVQNYLDEGFLSDFHDFLQPNIKQRYFHSYSFKSILKNTAIFRDNFKSWNFYKFGRI